MLLAFAGVSATALAQQAEYVEEIDMVIPRQDKYEVLTNSFWSNWFFSFGGGAEILFGDADQHGKFKDRVSPTLNVALGKWFTPGMGLRLQYSGLQARGYSTDAHAAYVRGNQRSGGLYKQRFDYMNLHGDVLMNLHALFGGYNPDRTYEIIPYLGAGFAHSYSEPHRQSLTVNAGIIQRFRLSDAMDFHIEIAGFLTEDKFGGDMGGAKGYDGVMNASLGFTYRFPRRGFSRPAPQLISQVELAAMQEKLADLALANRGLQSELNNARNRPVEVRETEVVVTDMTPRTVFFTIGSAQVDPRAVMSLSYLARQMQKFPNLTYTVNGYADSATGTPELNRELSRKRAQAVVDVLVKEYGIDASRLRVDANGGVDQFGQPILNRVVLVESEGSPR